MLTQFLQLTTGAILGMLDIAYQELDGQFVNSYHAMGKFSKWQTVDSFLIFPRK